jgi:hypothetical protein
MTICKLGYQFCGNLPLNDEADAKAQLLGPPGETSNSRKPEQRPRSVAASASARLVVQTAGVRP